MLAALGVDAKQLAIFSHRGQEGNERSRSSARGDSGRSTRGNRTPPANGSRRRAADATVARLLAASFLSQHTHSESGCEMNEWEEEDSEEAG